MCVWSYHVGPGTWNMHPHRDRCIQTSTLHLPPQKKPTTPKMINYKKLTGPFSPVQRNLSLIYIFCSYPLPPDPQKKLRVFFWVRHHESDVPMWPPAPSIREAQGLDPAAKKMAFFPSPLWVGCLWWQSLKDSHHFSRTLGSLWWQSVKTAISSAELWAVFDDNH